MSVRLSVLFSIFVFKMSTDICPSVCLSTFKGLHTLLRAAGVICEDLPQDKCVFTISSSSKSCVLGSYQRSNACAEYKCRSLEEVGGRSDSRSRRDRRMRQGGCFLRPWYRRICFLRLSSKTNCARQSASRIAPSIIDLYYNLAAGEGSCLCWEIWRIKCDSLSWITTRSVDRIN